MLQGVHKAKVQVFIVSGSNLRPTSVPSTGHRIGDPQPLLSNISDELIAALRERFAGSQADRTAAQAGKAAGKVCARVSALHPCCSLAMELGVHPGDMPPDTGCPGCCQSVCRTARQRRMPRRKAAAARQGLHQMRRSTSRGWTCAWARLRKCGGTRLQTGDALVSVYV